MRNSTPKTLVELLKDAASLRSEAEVIRSRQGKLWVGLTGKDLLARVRNVALGLYDLGVRRGDHIAILAESGPLWAITDYAILSNGAVNVPIYPTQAVNQVEYILRESEPKLLFISGPRQLQRVSAALKCVPDLRIVPFQPVADLENSIPFETVEERGARLAVERPELYEVLSSEVRPSDLASIIYTSGTTGEPKGVMLAHSNITFNALASGRFLGIEPDNVMLSFLPMSHIFERMVTYLCLHFGVQINFAAGIETVATDLRGVRPTLMSTVPRLLEKVLARAQKSARDSGRLKKRLFDWAVGVARRSAEVRQTGRPLPPLLAVKRRIADSLVFGKVRDALGGRIKRMVSGGAALPPETALIFNGMGVPVLQGYGLTETSPVIAVTTLERNRLGSVGLPLPGIEVRIADDGEILTRGAHVFKGYFGKPEETASVFIQDGNGGDPWFATGDIGYFDADGFLFITDRKKDLIKTSAGKYVAPQQIEKLIIRSEFVEQAVVLGDKRKYVSALVVPDFERLSSWASQLRIPVEDRRQLIGTPQVVELIKSEVNRLTRDLADYEKVRRIALLPDEFTIDGGELTPTLKVRRRVVEQKYKQTIDGMYDAGAE